MTLLICPACKEVGRAGDGGTDAWYMCPSCGHDFFAGQARSLPEGTVASRACRPLLTRESPGDAGGRTRGAREIGLGEGPPR